MKLPEWDESKKAWDAFKAFHVGIYGNGIVEYYPYYHWGNWNRGTNFVMFDTGELIYRPMNTRPHCRGHNDLLNVGLYRTIDHTCPRLYLPDGTKVPKAWLNYGGSQLIMVDHDQHIALPAGWTYPYEKSDKAPTRFTTDHNNHIYWPGDGKPPIQLNPNRKIDIAKPARLVLDKAQREHVDTILTTGRAAMALTEHPQTTKHYWQRKLAGVPANVLLGIERWDELDDNMLYRLFHGGVGRVEEKYEYLTTERSA